MLLQVHYSAKHVYMAAHPILLVTVVHQTQLSQVLELLLDTAMISITDSQLLQVMQVQDLQLTVY